MVSEASEYDIPAVVRDARLPLLVGRVGGEVDERARSLFEALGERVRPGARAFPGNVGNFRFSQDDPHG
jgi:hypothetical protein